MSLRKVTSLTALCAFSVLLVTGIVLYVVPLGRVAAWAGWSFAGLDKDGWVHLHILLSALFLVVGVLHIVLNWPPIVSYLKDRSRRLRVLTPELGAAVALTTLVAVSAVAGLPPLAWLLDLNDSIKDSASRTYGEPPYGHAELSPLRLFAQHTGLDLARARSLLAARGIRVAADEQTIAEIARTNAVTPQQVYLAMKDAAVAPTTPGEMPAEAPPGTGRKRLAALCSEYGLDGEVVARELAAKGITAESDRTIREIAEAHGMGPHDLYKVIREAVTAR